MKSSRCRWLFPLLCLALTREVRAADYQPTLHDGVTTAGDVMTYALPVAAMGVSAFLKDGKGAWELTKSGLITMSVSVALKYTVKARRPNNDPYSFPSGHVAISFVSAEYLRKRYGWQYGVPAYVAASFVGYSRVRANEHYFRDVAAAGAIGIVTTYFVTTPYHGWLIQPEFTAERRGIRFSREF
ncbi:MAG: phosphatase PAP2 family protein [Opitutaceae bacterium]|nr:phosphatase PAP2 family protein [Opitutaceae bacterium]